MAKTFMRTRRIADLIQQQLASFLKKEIRDPRLTNVVITSVDVSPDLSHARVYYTILHKNELQNVQIALHKATAYLRRLLAKHTDMKYTPNIQFIYDKSVIAAEELGKLIDEANTEDDKQHDSNN